MWKVRMMERNIGNVLFALFAVMLSIGSVFADSVNGSGTMTVNSPPVISGMGGPTSLNAGEAGAWSISAYDPNGNYLSYSVNWGDGLGQAQQGQTESGSTAIFQHTYSSAGTYTITFTVTDSMGAQTQSSVTANVQGTAPADQPPVINTFKGPSTLLAGSIGFWSLKVTDSDDTGALYTIAWGDGTSTPVARLLSGINYDQSFSHVYSVAGTYTATLSVTDDHGTAVAAQAATKTVVSLAQANQAPIITGVKAPVSLNVNEQGTWYVSAYDPDGTYLSYSVSWGDEKEAPVYKNVGTGSSASFQHTYSKAGTYTITFVVTDSLGASAKTSSKIVVGGSGAGLQVGKIWMEPDPLNEGNMVLLAKVTYNGQPADSQQTTVAFALTDTRGIPSVSTVGYNCQIQEYCQYNYYGMGIGTSGMPCGTMKLSVKAEGYGQAASGEEKLALSYPYCSQSTNLPPVINGVSGPAEISAGSSGTWSIKAYDPDGTYLSYSVNWGESNVRVAHGMDEDMGSTGTFQHTYTQTGTYTITFTVLDDKGASTQSTLSVKVTGSSSTSEVYASVGAIPTEVYQYDSVYVTGKISRGEGVSGEGAQTYRVVISLDNGNEIPKTATASSGSVASASAEGSVVSSAVAASGQGREEEVILYPGESREVSAYFTASKLGTNFAKVMVYQKMTSGVYKLVASDSTKVYVKESGIPQPPNEGVTITLSKGWNQISVPAKELSVSELAAKCDISENVWYYNAASKQYEKATTLGGAHVGYWVKANSECKYTIENTYITPAPYAFNLKAGWNMIGAPLSATAISNMAGSCKITSGPWNYSPAASQYAYSEKLEPGKGYWVKVAADCVLGSASDMPPAVPVYEVQGEAAN